MRTGGLWLFGGVGALVACDDAVRTAPAPAPSVDVGDTGPAAPDGCARSGSLEGVDTDPACALSSAPSAVAREMLQRLSLALEVDPPVVVAGSTATLRLTLTNVATSEVLIVLDARPRPPGPQADWSRIAGVPGPPDAAFTVPHLFFATTTLDEHERSVDAVPTLPGSAALPSPPKLIGVRLRPAAKVTYTASWWAIRIPAPAPVVVDDAGHRYVPKTIPVPLYPGEYTVRLDLPLHGVETSERSVSARVHVERSPAKPHR